MEDLPGSFDSKVVEIPNLMFDEVLNISMVQKLKMNGRPGTMQQNRGQTV